MIWFRFSVLGGRLKSFSSIFYTLWYKSQIWLQTSISTWNNWTRIFVLLYALLLTEIKRRMFSQYIKIIWVCRCWYYIYCLFYQRYHVMMSFLEKFEEYCVSVSNVKTFRAHHNYQSFINKWSLPVYFQIRLVATHMCIFWKKTKSYASGKNEANSNH